MAFLLSSFIVLLAFGAACSGKLVQAEHALSEVWSEADGLQMKYSTDHDEMLSTKGSELSLSSHQPSNKQETTSTLDGTAAQAASENQQEDAGPSSEGSSGESSSANGDSSSSSESSKSEGEGTANIDNLNESNNEQGADASKRADSRLPPNPPRHFVSASKQSRFSEPASRYSGTTEESRPSAAAALSSSRSEADNDDDDTRGGPARNLDSDAGSFSSAADEADRDDESSSDGPSSSGGNRNVKILQPGRLFKEAVKMGSSDEARTKQSEKGESPDEAEAARPDESLGSGREKAEAESSAEEPSAAGEPEFGPATSGGERPKKSEAQSHRQNMIDFDRIVDRQREVKSNLASSVRDLVNIEAGSEESDDESDGETRPGRANDGFKRAGGFRQPPIMSNAIRNEFAHDDEGSAVGPTEEPNPAYRQTSAGYHDHRHMTAGSTAHKERLAPASPSKAPVLASKQLAYFRGISQQSSGEPSGRRPGSSSAAVPSPDSVRDNFISPGHYPGSMPHLTQAASELQKKELSAGDAIGPAIAPVPPTNQKAVDLVSTASTISTPSSVVQQKPAFDTTAPIRPEESNKQVQVVSPNSAPSTSAAKPATDNRTGAKPSQGTSRPELPEFNLQVTPEPESQPESQQIMAPILLSTTTMAPMPSTSPPPATTETPSLKRFKFRKYR